MTSIKAASGIYIAIPIEEKSQVNLGKVEEKKLLKGKIIDIGEDRQHDNGGMMKADFKVGDTIYFISYSESYDWFEEDGQKYYCILFHDARAKI